MKQNENTIDRIIRLVVGVGLVLIGWFVLGNDVIGIILEVVGAVLVFTGLTGFCLLYKIFGFSTKK